MPRPAAFLLAFALLLPAAAGAQQTASPPDLADTLRAVAMTEVDRRPSFVDPAEVARVVEARYPRALRASGMGGTVVVRLVVDAAGRPVAPRLAQPSGSFELDRAALQVAEELRFVPAGRGGAPHPVWVDLPVTFVPPPPDRVDGVPAEQVRAWADSAGALAPSQVDARAEPRDPAAAARFLDLAQESLRRAGVTGTAAVWFVVDREGSPGALRVAGSSGRPELDTAALRTVQLLRFSPARRAGAPVAAWMTLPFEVAPPAPADPPGPDSLGAYELSEIDGMPDMINRHEVGREIARVYPLNLRDRGETGLAMVRFLVDAQGVPGRMTVESATHAEFADAAVRVIRKARFSPGRLGDRVVPVWVTLPVTFTLQY